MQIVIPREGRVRAVIHTDALHIRRKDETLFDMTGDTCRFQDVTEGQMPLFDDALPLSSDDELSSEILTRQLPFSQFLSLSAEEAEKELLALLLRSAVADGKITDGELLLVRSALEKRAWQAGVAVSAGDVYAHGDDLWKCVQSHTTQAGWTPDLTPALWHRVEVVAESNARVWAAAVEYTVDDVVMYPGAEGSQYKCLQAHTSLRGWEPPNVPALWQEVTA